MRKQMPRTRTERINWAYGVDAMARTEEEIIGLLRDTQGLPQEWHLIWENRDRRDAKRQKVTITLDADVVKFFKAMGEGYAHRINRVLRAYVHFRLAKLVEGPDTRDLVTDPDQVRWRLKREQRRQRSARTGETGGDATPGDEDSGS